MKVLIKEFDVHMEVKNKGIELEVRSANGKTQRGDLVVTKTKIIWCKGKTPRDGGKLKTWDQFITWMET